MEPPRAGLDPESLVRLQRRAYEALANQEGWGTAREIAAAVGGRPREAGNALAVLVDGGLAERRAGDGTPDRPAGYRALRVR